MPNQTSENNTATSNIVYFRQYLTQATDNGDCCFDVVPTVSDLDTITNPDVDHIAIVWDRMNPVSVPAIAIYLGGGNWLVKSLVGAKGDKGADGRNGENGTNGTNGTDGATGATGATGLAPAHRWVGTTLQFQNPNGSWGVVIDLKGEKGDRGNTGLTGATGDKPAHEWSDYSLRFQNPNGSWGSFTNLRGAVGATGNNGANGANGANGNPPRHEIDVPNFRLRFEKPDGSWGDWIVYGFDSTANGGIETIMISKPVVTDIWDISAVMNQMPEYLLPKGKLLHIEWEIPAVVVDPTYPEFETIPKMLSKWWYKGMGQKKFGTTNPTFSAGNFFCYYHSGSEDTMELRPSMVSMDNIGTFYKGMAYSELSETGKTLQDYMRNTERLVIRNFFESVKLDFKWGGEQVKVADLIAQANALEIGDMYNVLAGSYPVTYPTNTTGVLVARKLTVVIKDFEKIKDKSPVLVIDRYKKKKTSGKITDGLPDPEDVERPPEEAGLKKYKKSGFKHFKNIDPANGFIITEIPITHKEMVLGLGNFNQHNLFQLKSDGVGSDFTFRSSGMGQSKKSNPNVTQGGAGGSECFVRLRFRIRWVNTDERGRNKLFTTKDNGQLNVQIVNPRAYETENIGELKKLRILTYKRI